MTDGLTELDKAILASICAATGGSKAAHVPKQHFLKKFQNQSKLAKRALHRLISLGYVVQHPTGGEMTYELTQRGFEIYKSIRDQLRDLNV